MPKNREINIVVPMAGAGRKFAEVGYSFPKPLIDINGKPMIQLVIENIKPKVKHKFIFVCLNEHFEKYSLAEILSNLTKGNYEVIKLFNPAVGALCSVLTATDFINNDSELIIVNSDQLLDVDINEFIKFSRKSRADGVIITFESSHPRWSYARIDSKGQVVETVEKKVISSHATCGVYYFRKGSDFVSAGFKMIDKHITLNGEFYICPVYNEMILDSKKILGWEVDYKKMHSFVTPEDLQLYL